jgi:hypothetical protein
VGGELVVGGHPVGNEQPAVEELLDGLGLGDADDLGAELVGTVLGQQPLGQSVRRIRMVSTSIPVSRVNRVAVTSSAALPPEL